MTPAMAAGITSHIWAVREMLEAARPDGNLFFHPATSGDTISGRLTPGRQAAPRYNI